MWSSPFFLLPEEPNVANLKFVAKRAKGNRWSFD